MKQLHLSDQELAALAADLESDRVERKQSLSGDAPTKIREAICLFANDMAGHQHPGVIFVGLDDLGRPIGLTITDEMLQQLVDMRSDGNILPIRSMSVEKRQIAGADVAVITVAPSDSPPVTFKGGESTSGSDPGAPSPVGRTSASSANAASRATRRSI